MIKINTNSFDVSEIQKIYEKVAEELFETYSGRLSQKVNGPEEIAKKLVLKWFCEEGEPSKEKILKFLLRKDTRIAIDEFWNIVGEVLLGSPLEGDNLRRWPNAQDAAVTRGRFADRKAALTSVITGKNVHLFSGITAADLVAEPRRGTVYSLKSKIKNIQFLETNRIKNVLGFFESIFDYSEFAGNWRSQLIKAMHITVCPYCNRQYITMYKKGNNLRASADLDHFFSKARYPFLALSLYNLVPSCQICNSRLKGSIDFYDVPHINPYERGFEQAAVFEIQDVNLLLDPSHIQTDPESLLYRLVISQTDEEVENSIQTFCLNEHYQSHQDYVSEVITKVKIYSNSQIQEYLKQLRGLFDSREEFEGILFGNYLSQEDQGKRPLAKLTQDILTDLDWGID